MWTGLSRAKGTDDGWEDATAHADNYYYTSHVHFEITLALERSFSIDPALTKTIRGADMTQNRLYEPSLPLLVKSSINLCRLINIVSFFEVSAFSSAGSRYSSVHTK
jgi:hypothetical protein